MRHRTTFRAPLDLPATAPPTPPTATEPAPRPLAPVWPTRPRTRLPRRSPPFHNETLDSYLARIAALNRMTSDDLHEFLLGHRRKVVPATAFTAPLATVTGYDYATIRLALPELHQAEGNHSDEPGVVGRPVMRIADARPPCRRCVAARGITGPVTCWMAHEHNVCTRHRLWIGGPAHHRDDQLDLHNLPDIVAAQHRHHRLIRRHGRRWVFYAFTEARTIFATLRQSLRLGRHGAPAERVAVLHAGATFREFGPTWPTVFHPEIVSLTGILAASRWQFHAIRGGGPGIRALLAEIDRIALPGYRPHDPRDPVLLWLHHLIGAQRFVERHWQAYDYTFPYDTIRATGRIANDDRLLLVGW